MWYPATIGAPGTEPVTDAQAKEQCGVGSSDTAFNAKITRLITVARSHVEAYCGVRFGSRSSVAKCDSFDDMARLPDSPVTTVTSVTYIDTEGATQTLAASVYELRADGIEAAIVLKPSQSWPAIQPGSRITLTAVVGYGAAPYATIPEGVVHAMLLWIADNFAERESTALEDFTTMDALLINHRRNA